ncbi:MAG: ABC transporter ATP-binding protein, partial [Salinivirgaceae bacterium]|nr:ABC transporter ATP-binding protein [Salinivirgaceae bacterium]
MDNTSKRLYKYVVKQKKKILLGVLATLLMSLVELFTGSMLKFLTNLIDKFTGSFADGIDKAAKLPVKFNINHPITNEKIELVNKTLKGADEIFRGMLVLCLLFIGLYFLLALFNYLRRVFMNAATQRILQNFKEDIYNKILKLPFAFFRSNQTGDVVSRITYDVSTLSEIIDLLIEVARALIYIIVFIPVMFFMSWQLSIFTILFFPISVVLIEYVTRKIKRVSKNITDNVGDYTGFLEEKINSFKLVKAYGKEEEESKTFSNLVEENYRHNLRLIKLKFSMNPTNEFVGMLLLAVVYIFYSYKITHDHTSLGDIVFYLYLVKTLYKPVKKVAQAWGQLHVALVSTRKIFKLLDESEENDEFNKSPQSLGEIDSIEFRDVHFSYPNDERDVLQGISFKANAGEIIGLSGKTGAGKSTLLALLPAFFLPNRGVIAINNQSYLNFSIQNLRKEIRHVDSSGQFINGSIMENLAYGEISI